MDLVRPPDRSRRALLLAAGLVAGCFSCGASIQAVYEGNVRFEHCMALDSRPEIKPTIRRACWEEWAKFYTFGQTRDRVEYARLRQHQLIGASDFDEGEWSPLKRNAEAAAVPEPTSALAPPPMMMKVDGGAIEDAGRDRDASSASAASATPVAKPPANGECTGGCESEWTLCQHECRTPNCEKGCQGKYKKCMKRCF